MKCTRCKKNTDYYIKYSKSKSGVQYYMCNLCNTERAKKYRKTSYGKKNIYKAVYKSIEKYPLKHKARLIVKRNLLSKKINKPSKCQNCNSSIFITGHHKDYTKPLEIKWLCRKCHSRIHHK